jgi:hypothetical protein
VLQPKERTVFKLQVGIPEILLSIKKYWNNEYGLKTEGQDCKTGPV